MSRIRIVCAWPVQPPPGRFKIVHLPSIKDCRVLVVDDDGSERELQGVTHIAWSVGGSNVATARLEIDGVELCADVIAGGPGP